MPNIGDIVSGKIERIHEKGHGAYVVLDTGEKGFLHISQISKKFVKDIHKFIKVEQQVCVKIVEIKEKKISLSMVDVRQPQTEEDKKKEFEKKIDQFLKQSGEKMRQIQKNIDSKHGIVKRNIKK